MNTIDKQTITIPLKILVDELLTDSHYKEIVDSTLALVLSELGKKQCYYYIQFPGDNDVNIFGHPIKRPILWRYSKWADSTERYLRAQARAQKEREERFVQEFNINRVKRALSKLAPDIDDKALTDAARKIVLKGQEAKAIALGCQPFAKSVEEIS